MTKKIVLGVAVVALAFAVLTPAASAACIPAKSSATFGGVATAYWIPAGGVGTLVGQTWQLGAPGTWTGGNCNDVDGGYLFADGPGVSMNLNLGGCGSGCPGSGSTLVVVAQNKTATGTDFLLATVVETPGGNVNFDYGSQGDHNMVPMPKPRVTTSSRAGTTVNLQVQLNSVSTGLYGPNAASAITGFNVLSAASSTNPGRDASAYSLRQAIPSAGGAPATGSFGVDCTNPALDQWVVTQIQFEGGIGSSAVSEPTRVNCNPSLADPKYKIVPKRGTPKQGVGNNN